MISHGTGSGIATLDISEKRGNDWIVSDASGKIIPSRIIINGSKKSVSFNAENVPSLGYKTYFLRKGKVSPEAEIRAGSNFYENSFYSIEFGPGGIRSLYDKELKKQVFNTTKYAGGDLLSLGYNGNGAGEFIQIKPTNFEAVESLGTKNGTWDAYGKRSSLCHI